MILYDCSESKAMFFDVEGALLDRADFVRNVGALASQTREGVVSIEYAPESMNETELAVIHYKNGAIKKVNIRHNSYAAIVREIFSQI